MNAPEKKNDRRNLVIGCAIITCGALGYAGYLMHEQNSFNAKIQRDRTELDNTQAALHSLEERWKTSSTLLEEQRRKNLDAQDRIASLEQELSITEARASSLAQTIGRNANQSKELADLRKGAQDLRDRLDLARELELDLRTAADVAKADRDLFAHQLEEREAGARMVDNAELAALHGKKGKLTVKARRTNEIRMAFDLPGSLASGAQFTMTSPKGKQYNSAEPLVSASRGIGDATASVGLMATPDAASTSRVDLKFRTKDKLEPGVYRIEVRSGKDYLQTVYLDLR